MVGVLDGLFSLCCALLPGNPSEAGTDYLRFTIPPLVLPKPQPGSIASVRLSRQLGRFDVLEFGENGPTDDQTAIQARCLDSALQSSIQPGVDTYLNQLLVPFWHSCIV